MAANKLATSPYMKQMAFLSGRIFVDIARPTLSRDQRVAAHLAVEPRGRMLARWYPPLDSLSTILRSLRTMGVFRDEYNDFKEEVERMRKLRGKGSTWNPNAKKQKK